MASEACNESQLGDNAKAVEAGVERQMVQLKVKPYLKVELGLSELRTPRMWRDIACEVVAVFMLIGFVFGFLANFRTPENSTTSLLLVGVAAGLQVFVLVETFAHIQHAAMNPAVVILFTLTGRMSIARGLLMVLAECLGSTLGTIVVYSCSPPVVQSNFHPARLHEGMSVWQGLVIEGMITMSFIMLIAGATDDRNRKVYMPGLPAGMSIAAGILFGGHFTGGTMNPMVTFGPGVVTGIWTHHWIYWVGPLTGSVIGTLLYHGFTYDAGVFRKPDTQEQSQEGDYVACDNGNGVI